MSVELQSYKKISRDPDLIAPFPPRRGKSVDGNGQPRNGVYLQTFKKTEAKRYIRNGNVLGTFRYPKIIPAFHSPLLNDYNQQLCGGWFWQNREDGAPRAPFESNSDIILQRVIDGVKPLGGLVGWEDQQEKIASWNTQIAKAGLGLFTCQQGIKYSFVVCRPGILDELFEFEKLITDYVALDQKTTRQEVLGPPGTIEKFLNSIRKDTLEKYLRFDHLHPHSTFDYIVTGLILGYPIENTYAVLTE